MAAQAKNNQVEPDPLKRLFEMPPVGLFVKPAEAGQIREIDTSAQRKHRLEQLPQEAALPSPNTAVVNVAHLPEDGGYHRRE